MSTDEATALAQLLMTVESLATQLVCVVVMPDPLSAEVRRTSADLGTAALELASDIRSRLSVSR